MHVQAAEQVAVEAKAASEAQVAAARRQAEDLAEEVGALGEAVLAKDAQLARWVGGQVVGWLGLGPVVLGRVEMVEERMLGIMSWGRRD